MSFSSWLPATALSVIAASTAALTSVAVASDLKPFSRGELYTYIVGKTQVLEDGGAFYGDDGTLQLKRGDDVFKGTWSTKKTGELCWHIYDLGEIPCETYLNDGGDVVVMRGEETVTTPEIAEGNQLVDASTETVTAAEDVLGTPYVAPVLPERNMFTREETIAFLSDKTSFRERGGRMYYAPDFTLKTNWNGVLKTGTWRVTDEGAVCWEIVGWGPTPCEQYFYKKEGGILWARHRGKDVGAAKHVEGDQTETQ